MDPYDQRVSQHSPMPVHSGLPTLSALSTALFSRAAGSASTFTIDRQASCLPAGLSSRRYGHDVRGDWVPELVHHAARSEPKMVLATTPLPANPMETNSGLSRPGTFTLRTRMEYAGEVAGHAVKPWRTRQ